jgi:hypothetical protein
MRMVDQNSLKLISGFLGLLILGFIVFLIAGTLHINESEGVEAQAGQVSEY